MTDLKLAASERFLKIYRSKASIGEQRCALGAIHDFVRSYRADPVGALRRYDRVEGIAGRVFECDTSGSGRLLFHFEDQQMNLLDLGDKIIVQQYNDSKLKKDLDTLEPAPQHFWPEHPSGFFYINPDLSVGTYGYELSPDWLYWLDEEQEKTVESIQEDIFSALGYEQTITYIVVGGPGTGKSCILLNLLKFFVELGVAVGIKVSDKYAEYVRTAVEVDLSPYRFDTPVSAAKFDILLIDDPSNCAEIESYFDMADNDTINGLVIAFDPLQLEDDLSDERYGDWINYRTSDFHTLKSSYRQKENVGRAAQNAADQIAKSTPFLAEKKIEAFREQQKSLARLANGLVYRNPNGYTQVYREPTLDDVISEVQRINKPRLLWKHWYNLLVIEEHPGRLHEECYKEFNKMKAEVIPLQLITSIKGLEFPHVFMFISKDLYEQVEYGFKGTGQSQYRKRRLLRIPFSRAKDSLVTFVLNQELSWYLKPGA